MAIWRCLGAAVALTLAGGGLQAEERLHPEIRNTPGGIRFGIVSAPGAAPAPTVVIFANTLERSLEDPDFNRLGVLLRRQRGAVLVALDMPAHGADHRPGEAKTLAGWRQRLAAGEDIVADLMPKVSSVLDFLVARGIVDPARIGVCGSSRGGFMALHYAAFDSRVKWAVVFAPVTNLLTLDEFHGMAGDARTRSLALVEIAPRLTRNPIWMSIGNNDDRVGTDFAIGLSRRIVEAALAQGKSPDLELHVYATQGHRNTPGEQDTAAAWAITQMDRK